MLTFNPISGPLSPDSPTIHQLVHVFRAARKGLLQFSLDLHFAQEDRHFFAHTLLPTNQLWVAKHHHEVVGFIAFTAGWVNHLYMAPAFQRQGIGRQLLAIALQNNDTLRLWTFELNLPAIQFYQSHGFQILQRTDGSENEAHMPDLLLEWKRPV